MKVWVKAVGFSSEECHAIQTMLRLSGGGSISFCWWQPGCGHAPNVLLVDAESHAAALEIQSPSFNPSTKSIVVGDGLAVPGEWGRIHRPLDWRKLLGALETLFVSSEVDVCLHEPGSTESHEIPPGFKRALIVGLTREEQFYLKARLSLSGIAHTDEVDGAKEAEQRMEAHRYDVAFVACPLPAADVFGFLQSLRARHGSSVVIVAVLAHSNLDRSLSAASLGIHDFLEIPFKPHQVARLMGQL